MWSGSKEGGEGVASVEWFAWYGGVDVFFRGDFCVSTVWV